MDSISNLAPTPSEPWSESNPNRVEIEKIQPKLNPNTQNSFLNQLKCQPKNSIKLLTQMQTVFENKIIEWHRPF